MKQFELNEDTLPSGVLVEYNGKEYTTGNRRHTIVDLYEGKKFILNVDMNEIIILEPEKIISSLEREINHLEEQLKNKKGQLKIIKPIINEA